jgi:hypothetical protein
MIRSSFVPRSSTFVRASAGVAMALGALAPAFAGASDGASCPVRPTLIQQRVLAHAGSVEELRSFAYISRGVWGLDTYTAAAEIDKLRHAQAACQTAKAEPGAAAPSPVVALTAR